LALTISEALRAFEIFRPKPDLAAADGITVEPVWEMLKLATEHLKAENEHLKAELTTVKHELNSSRAADRKEFDRLVQLFAAHIWLSKSSAEKLQEGAETEAVLSPEILLPGLVRVEERPRMCAVHVAWIADVFRRHQRS